jgi:hypothetical protein
MRLRSTFIIAAMPFLGWVANAHSSGGYSYTPTNRCDSFVTLNQGTFKLDGQIYEMKSVNFSVTIAAREVPTPPLIEAVVSKGDGVISAALPFKPPIIRRGNKTYELFISSGGFKPRDTIEICHFPEAWTPHAYAQNNPWKCADSFDDGVNHLLRHISEMKSVGVNSIRLILSGLGQDQSIRAGTIDVSVVNTFNDGAWDHLTLQLSNAQDAEAYLKLAKFTVQFFGQKGIRSVFLIDGSTTFGLSAKANQDFIQSYLVPLAQLFKDEPYLIGFDLNNEPNYEWYTDGTQVPSTKPVVRDLVRSWVQAIRLAGDNRKALTTIGLSFPSETMNVWDPTILPVDFISYHTYGFGPRGASDQGNYSTPQWRAKSLGYLKQKLYSMKFYHCGSSLAGMSKGQCNDKIKPYILGEIGFATDNPLNGGQSAQGSFADQSMFIQETAPFSRACGSQGYTWWQYGNVSWGDRMGDNYGLWGDALYVNGLLGLPVPPADQFSTWVKKPGAQTFKDFVGASGPSIPCSQPEGFNEVWSDPAFFGDTSVSRPFHFQGVVKNSLGQPIPYATLALIGLNWDWMFATTNALGQFDIHLSVGLSNMKVSGPGYNETEVTSGFGTGMQISLTPVGTPVVSTVIPSLITAASQSCRSVTLVRTPIVELSHGSK